MPEGPGVDHERHDGRQCMYDVSSVINVTVQNKVLEFENVIRHESLYGVSKWAAPIAKGAILSSLPLTLQE
jgi:hypothetical protein